jgi:electron transfer flavoprotein beta subunit
VYLKHVESARDSVRWHVFDATGGQLLLLSLDEGAVRILVPLKLVVDPDLSNKVRVTEDGRGLVVSGSERKVNPFDEYALEAALRLTEDGSNPRQRFAEIIVATLGNHEADVMLRAGLATGADRAIRVPSEDGELDAASVAHVLARLVSRESCDLVLMGKQSSDGDGNEVGQRLAAILGWPQVTFVSKITGLADSRLELEREVDDGLQRLRVSLPAVVTVDLRIVTPEAVRSHQTPADFQYSPGVRFAPLPAIMKARKKSLEIRTISELHALVRPILRHIHYEIPPARACGRIVSSANELVSLLASEAKVL